jgi:O-antigen/teichoic acid export membrane protein
MDMAERTPTQSEAGGHFRSILRNASWILLGKGASGVLSVAYLALAARALGPHGFGVFVLILTFGQAVAAVAQFQTSDLVIRFGAQHLKEGRPDEFATLLLISTALDAVSAFVAAAIALAIAALAANWLGVGPSDAYRAVAFSIAFVVSIRGTPIGILRILDRFDLGSFGDFMLPAGRLIGAVISYAFFRSIDAFLVSWLAAELLSTVVIWAAALREVRRRRAALIRSRMTFQSYRRSHPHFLKFAWFTNAGASIGFFRSQAVTLLIGWGVGVSSAGSFRVAQKIAQAVAKPVTSLSRAVYPELSHLAARDGHGAVLHTTDRLARFAGVLALVAFLVALLFGRQILVLIAGPPFGDAYPVLVLLTVASAIELWGFGQEPALLSMGRADLAVSIKGGSLVIGIGAALLLMPRFGSLGAASAVIISNLANRAAMSFALAKASNRSRKNEVAQGTAG